jgi:16S rRNA (guanine1516-N2)-methyltransferase
MKFLVQVTEDNDLPEYELGQSFVLEKTEKKADFFFRDQQLFYRHGNDEISFDFVKYLDHWNKTKPAKQKDNLGRALGLKKGEALLDFCCGTGKDSSLFIYWGLDVISFERHPIVYLLLVDALRRLKAHERYGILAQNFTLLFGNASDLLENYESKTIYYDPMFGKAKKKNKAKARKEMEFFKSVVGADEDALEVIGDLTQKGYRIILKRPDDSFDLALPKGVSLHKWSGKTTEFWRIN